MEYNMTQHPTNRIAAPLTEQPSLILSFYSFGVMLRKQEGELITEYAVDPAQIALALAAKVTFDTGVLAGNTLLVQQDGVKKTIVEYRPPQKTGLFLDDSETALRVLLPGLVMIRVTASEKTPQYGVFAVKRHSENLDIPLFHAPDPQCVWFGRHLLGQCRASRIWHCAAHRWRTTGQCCSAPHSVITPLAARASASRRTSASCSSNWKGRRQRATHRAISSP